MQYVRGIALVAAAGVLFGGLAFGQKKKKKGKKGDEEEITQTLPVLQDPPAAVVAAADRLVFRTSTLSAKGLLTPQVRDALKELIRDHRGAQIVKLRAFVAGTGDVRRVQTLVSEVFTEKHLPLPALTTVLTGGLPLEGAQVAIESIAVDKRSVNPHGIAFVAGRAGTTPAESIRAIETTLGQLGLTGSRVLRATCFLSTLEAAGDARSAVASAFPAASLNIVEMTRVPVRPAASCEAVAALERPSEPGTKAPAGVGLARPGDVVLTGLQMGFQTQASDVKLAFDRLAKTVEANGGTYKDAVFAHVYLLSGEVAAQVAKEADERFGAGARPAATVLPFEGLPSVDASFGIDVVTTRGRSN